MCNCYDETKKKLIDHIAAKMPAGSEKLEIEIQGYVFGITDDGVSHRSSNAVKGSYMAPQERGRHEAGSHQHLYPRQLLSSVR